MGKPWTMPEQEVWLKEKLPGYLLVLRSKKATRFITVTQEEWFRKYSERKLCFPNKPDDEFLSEEENEVLSAAIERHKTQLKDWLQNHARKLSTVEGKKEGEILKALNLEVLKHKAERAPHQIEVYLKLFPEKVEAQYTTEVARLEISTGIKMTRGMLLQLRRNIASKLLEADTPNNQKKVADDVAEWKEKRGERLQLADHSDPTYITPTPTEYQKSIEALPGFLKIVFEALAQSTGWTFGIVGGGPRPEYGGKVFVDHFHFGPKTTEGKNNFSEAYANFDRDVMKPWSTHALNCYELDVCASRALIRDAHIGMDAAKIVASASGHHNNDDDTNWKRDQDRQAPDSGGATAREPEASSAAAGVGDERPHSPAATVQCHTPAHPRPCPDTPDLAFLPAPPFISTADPSSTTTHHANDDTYSGPTAPGGPSENILNAFARMSNNNTRINPLPAPPYMGLGQSEPHHYMTHVHVLDPALEYHINPAPPPALNAMTTALVPIPPINTIAPAPIPFVNSVVPALIPPVTGSTMASAPVPPVSAAALVSISSGDASQAPNDGQTVSQPKKGKQKHVQLPVITDTLASRRTRREIHAPPRADEPRKKKAKVTMD